MVAAYCCRAQMKTGKFERFGWFGSLRADENRSTAHPGNGLAPVKHATLGCQKRNAATKPAGAQTPKVGFALRELMVAAQV